MMNDKGRSHQQSQALLKEERIPCRRGSFAQSFQDYAYFGAFVAGKVREIAIAREVGDSVLYHSPFGLASGKRLSGATCPEMDVSVGIAADDFASTLPITPFLDRIKSVFG
jgi:hypothetical protein